MHLRTCAWETSSFQNIPLSSPIRCRRIDADYLDPCPILIGNEGAGLSLKARRLADEQVIIPSGVESLNAAVAGSILMYEVMSQRVLRQWARKQGLRL